MEWTVGMNCLTQFCRGANSKSNSNAILKKFDLHLAEEKGDVDLEVPGPVTNKLKVQGQLKMLQTC